MKKIFSIIALVAVSFFPAFGQKAIVFPNSTASYATAADNAVLNLASGQSFTVSAWVKPANNSANQLFLAKRLNGSGVGYELWQMNGYFAVNCTHTGGSSSGLPAGSKYKINDGKWHQIAFVVDVTKNMYYMYVDGKIDVSKALVNANGFTNTDKLYFGIRGNLSMPMNGAMDEVRIYNKALSQDELMADMAATVSTSTANLAAAWNFEEGTGTTAADIKGTCNATLIGTPTWETLTTSASQTITMNGPINVAYGSADFSPATSTSSMPVTYTTSDPAVATVVNGMVHIVGKGSCTLTASQSANLFYAAATPVIQTFNVTNTLITFNLPFTNHAVIQRDQPITISGTADPNDVLTLNLDGEIKTANVDATGKWSCTFSAKSAKSTAFTLTAEGSNSMQTTLTDLLCGDVWVASGQSNMLMPIGPGYNLGGITNYSAVIAAANYPNIRFIQPVDLWQQASTPQTALLTASNGWTVCSPTTAGGYSAAAYFFAKQIHLDQNIPIGIIQNAVGGTRIEAWTSLAGLQSIPEYASWYTKATATTMETGQTYNRKNFPTANYNGMLAPYTHNPIKGIIWYQGEENLGIDLIPSLTEYGNKFKATIQAWRNVWNDQNIPVIFTELANFKYSANYSGLGGSREALPRFISQQRKATQLQNVYGITISDVSNYNDIHPADKATVGTRMGNTALGYVYGKNIVPNAATFKEMRSEGSSLRVSFNNNSGFYLSSGTSITEFKIAGADKVYKTATATLSGNDVLVSESTIAQPLYIKYAWDENANPNLFNGSGSPTSRFADSLKINQINFTAIPATLKTGDADIALQATATSGLPVAFASSNTSVAEIVNGSLHIVGEGTTTITASEAGNTVYAAALPVQQFITVSSFTALTQQAVGNINFRYEKSKCLAVVTGVTAGDSLTLIGANGKILSTVKAISGECKVSLTGIAKGNYLIRVCDAKGAKTFKFTI